MRSKNTSKQKRTMGNVNKWLERDLTKQKKGKKLGELLKVCRVCSVGSCCYEGVELNLKELRRIIRYRPQISKPWFRLVKDCEKPEKDYFFSTVMRDGTCVFQDSQNRCVIYRVRPQACRDFPKEQGRKARYCERLCFMYLHQWPNNSVKKTFLKREKN